MKEEVKEWMKQSNKDLKTAKNSFKSKDYYAASFWCQQSVEKALKALLIENTNNFPKVHDLRKLAELNSVPKEIMESCVKINPSYTASRYPDIANKYTKKDSEKVLNYCKEVLKWIKKNLN